MTALHWLLAMADAAYCESYWNYVNQWDRLMMVFRENAS
jgi:hypothetical protein